ncbi:MAG: 50S ribosomal protein L22 [bacterium]|nr:50S ribosomal protein L22 [bacterium]
MEAKATGKYIRISTRKTRWVADLVRGLSVEKAQQQLTFTFKAASPILLKLLKSAVANAKQKKMAEAGLYIKSITVDGGPTLKRWQPRAFGRATPIRKRSSHITIILSEK